MNPLQDLERVIRNASRPGYFRRDQEGNEHEVSGFTVQFTYEHRGERVGETAVVIAPNRMVAQTAATKPYKNVEVIKVESHHLSNPTVLRIPHLLT